jgi:DNA modification methylase
MAKKKADVEAEAAELLPHIAADLRHLAVPVDSLVEDPENARSHPEENLMAIMRSMHEFGQDQPVVVRKDTRVVVKGNGRLVCAKRLGWTHIAAVLVDESEIKATARAIADNRSAELAVWSDEILAKLIKRIQESGEIEASATGFTNEQITAMLAAAAPKPPAGQGGDEFDATPAEGPTRSNVGEIWLAGGVHRLLCGDCTDAGLVERLMGTERCEMVWTDPPYGVAIGDKNKYLNSVARSNRVEENLDGDTLDEESLAALLKLAFAIAAKYCLPGAAWYVAAPGGPLHMVFGLELKAIGVWRQTIQWVKNNATFSPMGVCYHWRAEPIFFGWLPNGGHRWYGGRKQDTVWEIDRPQASPDHPTTKPIELVQRAVENSSRPGEMVYDPFLGSGTTLVSCHRLGRRCFGAELDPHYFDVVLKRAEAEGMKVELASKNEGGADGHSSGA